jgi:hypothetical protein
MTYPGYFRDHIVSGHLDSHHSLSRRYTALRGGTAPNIGYTMALLR